MDHFEWNASYGILNWLVERWLSQYIDTYNMFSGLEYTVMLGWLIKGRKDKSSRKLH